MVVAVERTPMGHRPLSSGFKHECGRSAYLAIALTPLIPIGTLCTAFRCIRYR